MLPLISQLLLFLSYHLRTFEPRALYAPLPSKPTLLICALLLPSIPATSIPHVPFEPFIFFLYLLNLSLVLLHLFILMLYFVSLHLHLSLFYTILSSLFFTLFTPLSDSFPEPQWLLHRPLPHKSVSLSTFLTPSFF